ASLAAQDRSLKEQILAQEKGGAKAAPPKVVQEAAGIGGKRKVPGADQLKAAEKLVKDLFKSDYAKTDAEGRAALIVKLLAQADENKADAAAEYTLLREARDAAILAGDAGRSMQAYERSCNAFSIGGNDLMSELSRIEPQAHGRDSAVALVGLFLRAAGDT